MKPASELNRGHHIKVLAIGATGSGKTHLCGTFPKTCFLSTEPGGMTTIAMNPHLKSNLVVYDEFIPTSPDDTKHVFDKLKKSCRDAKAMAKEGKIETLVVDNLTYLAENRWIYINKYESVYARSGELDTRGMYGALGRWLYNFVYMDILSFPGHVIVTVHERMEDEDALKRKPDKSYPIVPNILGGFRDTAGGMFSCVFFLSHYKSKQDGKYRYMARTMKGNMKGAKNRYNLPETIEGVGYPTIMGAIKKVEGDKD